MKESAGQQKQGKSGKEISGNDVEVVWACDEMRGTLRRMEGNWNRSTNNICCWIEEYRRADDEMKYAIE